MHVRLSTTILFPSTFRELNNIPLESRNSEFVYLLNALWMKDLLLHQNIIIQKKRRFKILHTRLRTNCSASNNDLFLKRICDFPYCQCGVIENAFNFLNCPQYAHWTETIDSYCDIILYTLFTHSLYPEQNDSLSEKDSLSLSLSLSLSWFDCVYCFLLTYIYWTSMTYIIIVISMLDHTAFSAILFKEYMYCYQGKEPNKQSAFVPILQKALFVLCAIESVEIKYV